MSNPRLIEVAVAQGLLHAASAVAAASRCLSRLGESMQGFGVSNDIFAKALFLGIHN